MTRAYDVVDADGHILEPLDLWDNYIDPEFRERRPRFVIDENGKERLKVEGKLLGNPRGIGSLGSVGVRQGAVKPDTLKYAEGKKGGFDPHARIVDMDADGIDAAFLYPSLGLFAGAVEDPGLAAANVPRLQPLARRLLQALSRPAVRGRDAADAVGRARDRGDALRRASARDARRLSAAEPVSRQQDDQRPDIRAVLGDGRGARLLDRLPRGLDHCDAHRRRRPLRGRPRGAPHDQPHDGDDAGGDGGDLGRRRRSSPAAARRVPRIGRRLDRALARPHGPAFRRPRVQRHRPEDAAERALPAQLLDFVRAGREQHRRAGRLYRPAQDHVGDRLSASGRLLPGRAAT